MSIAFLPFAPVPPYHPTRIRTRAHAITVSVAPTDAPFQTPAPVPIPSVNWKCVPSCGACCKIGGYDPEVLDEMLPKESDRYLYESMVGPDHWCVNFDKSKRNCTLYDDRPWFCRVGIQSFQTLYKVKPDDMDSFAAECCTYHIQSVYGEDSPEMQRFDDAVGAIWDEDPLFDDDELDEDADFVDVQLDRNDALDQPQIDDEPVECDDEVCEIPDLTQPEKW